MEPLSQVSLKKKGWRINENVQRRTFEVIDNKTGKVLAEDTDKQEAYNKALRQYRKNRWR